MPLNVFPIVHKFGIISQTHKKLLQQRLLERKKQLQEEALKKKNKDDYVFHINEDFVNKYNETDFRNRAKLDEQCSILFEKQKRRLNNNAQIDDIALQIAWAELSQLVQCNSPIQEECMDLFIITLESSHLSSAHITTLFFLAETVLYWIRMDTINQPFLRSLEIKLLKAGQLVFQRIYYHFIEGALDYKEDLKQHLSVYLDGFEESEVVYSPYPDALLYMRYIIAVGKLILKPVKEILPNNHVQQILPQVIKEENDAEYDVEIAREATASMIESNASDALKIHDLSPTLWHSVDLFVCSTQRNSAANLHDSALSLIDCSLRLNDEHWVDCMHAFNIIGECAKLNINALNALMNIAEASLPDLYKKSSLSAELVDDFKSTTFLKFSKQDQQELDSGIRTWTWELGCVYVEILTDICLSDVKSDIRKKALLGKNKNADDVFRKKFNKLTSYGLLDMTNFYTGMNKSDEDWGWKLRYTGIKGLVRICKTLRDDRDNEDFRQICWSSLVLCQEYEQNQEVLEAIKVGQVGNKLEETNTNKKPSRSITNKTSIIQNNIHCQMAKRLGDFFIVPIYDKKLESPIRAMNESEELNKIKAIHNSAHQKKYYNTKTSYLSKQISSAKPKEIVKQTNVKKIRPTLKEEIEIRQHFAIRIPDYNQRKSFDLMRIVEDQYRKEIDKEFTEQLEKQKLNN